MATSKGNWENSAGIGVFNHYGERGTQDSGGVIKTEGSTNELTLVIDGTMVSDGAIPRATATLPAGAKVTKAYVHVTEVFVLTGTTPTIDIGTQGTEGTNGFDITEAQAEALGVYEETTFAGTWAAELAASTVVDVALGGTTPASTSAGQATIVIEYVVLK
jgi:hypothetical protein